MTVKAVIYKNSNGEEFLKLDGHDKNREYTTNFLENLTGFKLSEYAGWSLKAYGFIRVTKGSEGSYRKD